MDLGPGGGQQGAGGHPYHAAAYHQMRSPFSGQNDHQNESGFGSRAISAAYPFYQNVHLTSNPLGPYASAAGAGAQFLSYQSPGSPREGTNFETDTFIQIPRQIFDFSRPFFRND